MIRNHFSMKILAWIIVFSLCIPYGFAQEVGKITYVEGRVDILKAGSDKGVPVIEYENISVGDSLRTKSNSKVEIKFKDESIVRLAQNSKIEIKDYQLDEKNKRKAAAIKLERGKLRTIVSKSPQAADFAIITPNSEGVVKGSDVFAFYQAGSSGLLVADGRVALTSTAHPQDSIVVPAGSSALVPLEKLPEGPRPYLEIEKKLHEQDTEVPFSEAKAAKLTVITGNIAKFSGKVLITNKGQDKPHEAKIGEVVKEGDLIEALDKSLVEIRLDNNNAINMKSNSKLLIIKLALNPQTQEYENIFELTIGKIKARIEGLKGKSKFEVKTPLAICGARGTILYVTALPNVTSSFLEGGNGYIINNADGTLNDIPAGQQGSVTLQGTFYTSGLNQDDRQGFTEGWDPGTGVEGYSAPEGSTGGYLYGSDTGTGNNTGNNTGAGTNTGTNTGEPVDLPLSESNPGTITTTTTTEPTTLSGDFSGNFAYYDSWDTDSNKWKLYLTDTITNGGFTGTGTLWSGSQSVTLSGSFTRDPSTPFSWYEEDLWIVDSNDLYGTTTDGARFLGTAGGIKVNNSLKGVFYGLYVRPVGSGYQAGYFSSTDLSGNIDSGLSGGFTTSGTLSYHDMGATMLLPADVSKDSTHIKKGNEQGKLASSFLSDDSLRMKGTLKVNTFEFRDSPTSGYPGWGIWRVAAGGSYVSKPIGSWSTTFGGSSVDDDTNLNGYWIGTLSGSTWGDNDFSATMDGTILNDDSLQEINGKGYGIHYPHELSSTGYSWEFLGAGEDHRTTLLTSSGRFVAQGWIVDPSFDFAGQIGLVGPIWAAGAHPEFISMGEFNSGGAAQFAWEVKKEWGEGGQDGFVSRYDNNQLPISYTYTTYDDKSGIGNGIGSLYGLAAGVGGNVVNGAKTLKGKIYSLYISPTTTTGVYDAGVLYGDVNGNYYDGIGMYRLDGELTKHLCAQNIGISPQNLHTNISWDTLSGLDDYGGGDGIIIYASWGEGTMLNISQQNWGVWNLVTGGDFTYEDPNVNHNNWDVYDLTGMTTTVDTNYVGGSWLGGIGYFPGSSISSKWSGNEIEGELRAIWIGLKKNGELSGRKVNGETTGNYVEVGPTNGTWQAGAAGEWVEINPNLANGNLTQNILDLGVAANIPITEAYSSLMTGAAGGITSMTMDMHLYNMVAEGHADGIWAAIINGYYSSVPTTDWSITIANGADNAILSGPAWSNGQWVANNVTGTVNGNTITGQAAGTYGDGQFSGSGTGTYID